MNKLDEELVKVNEYISQHKWMDFEVKQVNSKQIMIIGSTDLQLIGNECLEIIIENPTYIASNISEWHTDTSKEVVFCEQLTDGYYKVTIVDDNSKLNYFIGSFVKIKTLGSISH